MFRAPGLASFSLGVLTFLFTVNSAGAQVVSTPPARPLITQNIDEGNLVELSGNTRAEAIAANDRGAVADNLQMDHMLLQLRRSPAQEQALQQFIDQLQTKGSPDFHQWITAQEFGTRFGLAQQDLDTITRWLGSHGFSVNVVYPNGTVIDFSGTAGQVREAFKTEIHHLEVNGEQHIANMSNPKVPAALASAVAGIVSLHDFKPHTMNKMRQARPDFTFSGSYGNTFALVPADLATIYNLNPLFSAGFLGQGQTIVVIEDTDVFSTSDWNTFRSALGLSSYSSGSFSRVYPAPSSGANNCNSPGIVAPNDAEAILDAEWASAAAPNATIQMAICADSITTFGGLIALQNLINASSQPPAIMSISYGQCETQNGASANAAYNAAYQQAVSEGVSVFVAAGDSGAAGCDNSVSDATNGIGVNAFASTPYNVAVGGTDFSDTYAGTNSNYWDSTNTPTYGSALSYIPEIPWNDSCAGQLLSSYEGYPTPYGSSGFCNSSLGGYLQTTVAGGGGPSGCATGAPSVSGNVGGSCQGWPKPSWQSVLGNPNDGVRDTPDVSLFAADGLWSHYYVFCWSDTKNGGAACSGAPSGWSGAGGTSFASPIMAGIQALVNEKTGDRQGNPNPAYYQLATTEYGSSGSTFCNSSNGSAVAGSCIFYDVTQGDMDVNCTGKTNCYLPSGATGVLSTSESAYDAAYGSTTGWDFASGIGSVNAANLANNWPSSGPNYFLSVSPSSLILTQGANGASTITVTPENGFGGNVALSASGLPSGVTASFSPNPATATSTLTLTASGAAAIGTVSVTITGTSGSLTNTTTIALTVNSVGNYSLSGSPTSLNIAQGTNGTSTITVTPQNGFSAGVSLSASGLPSGVTALFSPNPATATSTLTLTASSAATIGTVPVTITGTSGSLTNTTTITLTVAAPPNYTLSASPSSLTIPQGTSGTSMITVTPQNGFSGGVSLSASGLSSGVTALFSPNPATATSTLTLTASGAAAIGTVSVTITGTSGSLTNTTTIALTVNSVGNYSLSGSPTSLNIAQGTNGTSTITVTPQNGFSAGVSLSASGLPSGVTALFSPNPASATSTLTLTASSAATIGTVPVTITGTSGSLTNTTTITLTVAAPPNYTLSASPSSLTIPQGTSGTSMITVTPQNGFSGGVSLSASGLPSGVTALFSPNPATATSTLTLTAGGIATTGTVSVTITGTSGSLTHTTTITLKVIVPPLLTVWLDQDVGQVGLAGSSGYASGVFTVEGAGTSLWGTADGFNFMYQPLSGDGTIVARVLSASSASAAGAVIRDTLNANAMSTFVAYYGSKIYFNYRSSTGGSTSQASTGPVSLPYWVKVSRSGNTFSSYASADGVNWVQFGTSQTIPMGQNAYVGLGVSSGSTSSLATATFDNVSLNSAASPAPVISSVSATTGPIGSQVVISGSGFGATQGSSVVELNGTSMTINSWSATSITVTIASGATSGPLAVSVAPSMNNSNSVTFTVTPQLFPLPASWLDQDVGQVGLAGSSGYASGVFTVEGAGTSLWGTADGFNFMYQPLSGDGTIVARVLSASSASVAGAVIRDTLNANAMSTFVAYYGSKIYFNYRSSTGGSTSQASTGPVSLPYWVKVSRSGNTFSSYASADGVNWVQFGTSQTIPMGQNAYVGLGVSSGSTSSLATATFDNVSLNSAASPAPVISSVSATTGPIGSQVVISGSGFGATQGSSVVELNGTSMTINSWSATSITVTIASGATSGPLAVSVAPSMNNSNPVTFTVGAPTPNYTLTASPSSLNITQETNGTSTITMTPQNGFSGGVSLSASGLPSGVTASFSPNPATATSTLTLTASGIATTGTVSVTITGTSGSLTNTTTITLTVTSAPTFSLPSTWFDGDVGSVGLAGSSGYANGVFTVEGAGTSLWGTADGFNFMYQPLSGDGTIVARVLSASSASVAGVVIRDTLNANAMSTFVAYYGSKIYFNYRSSTGGSTSQASTGPVSLPYWVKVSRSGNTFSSYASADGVNWVQFGTSQTIPMGQNAYVGLGVSSGSTSSLATATFDNVSLNSAASPAPVISSVSATTGPIGSQVVISGSGFGATQGSSVVELNGTSMTINSWSATSITVTIASGATSGPLAVSVAPSMNNSNSVTFTVTPQSLPASWLDQDVGQVGLAGSSGYASGVFTVEGAGTSLWGTADGFHFVYQPLSGDGTIVARVLSASSASVAGVVIRDTLNANAMSTFVAYYGSKIYFNYRSSTGGSTSRASTGPVSLPYWVKVSRSGNTFSSYASADGVNWVQFGTSQTIPMGQNAYVGLGVSSGSTSSLATATFDNVSVNPD